VQDPVGLRELDLVVLDDLHPVAVDVVEVEPAAREDLRSCTLKRPPHRLLVRNHEAEVRCLRMSLHESQELVAHVDESRPWLALLDREIEDALVKGERAVDVGDLEGDMVDPDETLSIHFLLRVRWFSEATGRSRPYAARVLYMPDVFEPLTETPWDGDRVREAIRSVVADADAAFDDSSLWPADSWDAWTSPLPLQNLYAGATGVIWALDVLRRRGYAETSLDLAALIRRTLEAWREKPDFATGVELPPERDASLLMGESGMLLVAYGFDPQPDIAGRLHARARENLMNETNELMWGSPGTMLAARAMLEWTGEDRWADVWRESADMLLRGRDGSGVWTQRLHGTTFRDLGPVHGLVGNVSVLLNGGLLDAARADELRLTTRDVLARNAVVEDSLANWPALDAGELVPGDGLIRVQWCHGAPGIVTSAPYLDDALALAGAELTWLAGPSSLEKGAGICHGTAGNGYALLKTFERTGDEEWLERAKRFAVHALEQVERMRAERGRGRYSLWTGDVGVALYAADCLDARAAYPVVDTLD
jgi:Lanthionine synthetase C-like protein